MRYFVKLGEAEREFSFVRRGGELFAVNGGEERRIDLALVGDGGAFSLIVDGRSYDVLADIDREKVTVQMLGERFVVHAEDERERAARVAAPHKPGGRRELRAAMPGVVVEVKVAAGTEVEEGQTLVVLEAMKMQNPLLADAPGRVTRVLCRKGEAVAGGALLMELE
jgi:biotin carboxyl carrier protein